MRSALSSRLPRMRNAPSPICTTSSRRPQTSRRRHDERTALAPALAGAYLSGNQRRDRHPLSVARRPMRPLFPRAGYCDLTVILLAFLRGGRLLPLQGSSLCRANLARGLRVHFAGRVTLDGRAAPLPFRFVPQHASLGSCQMCAVSGDRMILSWGQGFNDRQFVFLGRFFWHTHVVLDWACLTGGRRRCAPPRSYPRNSRLRLSSPGPLRVHSSRKTRKSCPGCPLLRAGPFGVRVERLRSVASHRGRDGRGPGN